MTNSKNQININLTNSLIKNTKPLKRVPSQISLFFENLLLFEHDF